MSLSRLKNIIKSKNTDTYKQGLTGKDATLLVENSFTQLIGMSDEVLELIKKTLTYENQEVVYELKQMQIQLGMAYRYKAFKRVAWLKNTVEDLKSKLQICWLKGNKFPTGHLNLVTAALDAGGIKYRIEDARVNNAPTVHYKWHTTPMEPRYIQTDMVALGVKHHRGVFEAAVGCHGKGQGILMFDGSIKAVENIVIGDQLMGPDSQVRTVTELYSGRDELFEVVPVKGEPFIVNKNHVLALERTSLRKHKEQKRKFKDKRTNINRTSNTRINMTVGDFLKQNSYFRKNHKLFRTGVTFSNNYQLKIPAYILGLWLGDGHSNCFALTTMDEELKTTWSNYVKSFPDYTLKRVSAGKAYTYFMRKEDKSEGSKPRYIINKLLKDYNLIKNKHIPHEYKTASEKDRLELLAGIIDTDGYYGACFSIVQKNKTLANDIIYLARSLGFAAYAKTVNKTCVNNGVVGEYVAISISGDLERIPTKIKRKQATKREQKKSVLRTGFKLKSINASGEYFGFSVDKDNLYLLDDFTVTHNSGKTYTCQLLIHALKVPALILIPAKDLAFDTYQSFVQAFGEDNVELVDSVKKVKTKKPIKICTIHSLTSFEKKDLLEDLLKNIGMLCIDEVHHAGAKTYTELLPYFNHIYYRFGFSGTFLRNDSKTLDMWGFLSTVLYRYSAVQATQEGFLTPFKILVHDIDGIKGSTYHNEYNKNYCNNEDLLETVKTILTDYVTEAEQVLILVGRKEKSGAVIHQYLNDLGVSNEYVSGDSKKDAVKTALNNFNNKITKVLIGSSVLGEGIDIRSTNHLIMLQGGKSEIAVTQAVGRLVRLYPGKDMGYLHDIRFNYTKYLIKHIDKRLEIYQKNFGGEVVC